MSIHLQNSNVVTIAVIILVIIRALTIPKSKSSQRASESIRRTGSVTSTRISLDIQKQHRPIVRALHLRSDCLSNTYLDPSSNVVTIAAIVLVIIWALTILKSESSQRAR